MDGPVYALTILILSIVSVAGLAASSLGDFNTAQKSIMLWMDTAICVVFAIDFLISLRRAPDKKRYLLTWGWLDFLSSIPIVGPLRAARFARIARVLRVLRGIKAGRIVSDLISQKRKENVLLYAAITLFLILISASLLILQVEDDPNSNIKTASDALWWAITTLTTVGYGDKFPVTPEGRIIAACLMVFGLGLFSLLSGAVASWMLVPQEREQSSDIEALTKEIRQLRALIETRSSQVEGSSPTGDDAG